MFTFRRICYLRTQVRHATKKAAKKEISAYDRHKEEKLMFGGVIETKREKQARTKKQIKNGEPLTSKGASAPDSETYWLENLCSKDLKVFRKTSNGRYKEVEKVKVLDSLKSLNTGEKPSKPKTSENIALPDIVVRNITSVPMLAATTEKSLTVNNRYEKFHYPSVTKILSETMSPEAKAALERWKLRMIADLGEDGFLQYNQEQLSLGSRFHSCVRCHLEGSEPLVAPDLEPVWASVQKVLPVVTNVKCIEAHVTHHKLRYKGVVDCVASYEDTPSVIEWKVSHKSKNNLSATYDAPLQLSAYLGALSYDSEHRFNLQNGLVVVAYKDGTAANVFRMDEKSCRRHWELWLGRLQRYWGSVNSNILAKSGI